MEMARLMAEARAKKHWTLEQAADALGVSANTVNAWERGKRKPYAYNMHRICEVYGLSEDLLYDIPPVALQDDMGEYIQSFIRQDLTMRLNALASPHRSHQEIHTGVVHILKEYDGMTTKKHRMTRRKALMRLVTLPFATPVLADAFTSEEVPSATLSKDILAQCAVSIAACWELRKSAEYNDLALAFEGASSYLPVLQRIVKNYSQYREEAANLVAQCLLLKAQLAQHVRGIAEAAQFAQQAVFYSETAKDLALRLKAFQRISIIYTYGKKYGQALQSIQQAEPLLKEIKKKNLPVSPHVQALICGELACTLTRNKQDGSAYLAQANALLPENEDAPVYANYGRNDLLLDTGTTYLLQGKSEEAVEIFSQAVDPETFALKMPWDEVGRIETINTIAMASMKAKDKDMERTLHFWQAGIEGAKALRSEQRFNEALNAYDIMGYIWPREARIEELRDLTEHW